MSEHKHNEAEHRAKLKILEKRDDRIADASYPVDSHADWQNTGILVKSGDIINIFVVGSPPPDGYNNPGTSQTWSIGRFWPWVTARGYLNDQIPAGNPNATPVFCQGAKGIDWHWGSLIGAIGQDFSLSHPETIDVASFEVGLQKQVQATADGYLWLNCNDSRKDFAYWTDNQGTITVRIQVP